MPTEGSSRSCVFNNSSAKGELCSCLLQEFPADGKTLAKDSQIRYNDRAQLPEVPNEEISTAADTVLL